MMTIKEKREALRAEIEKYKVLIQATWKEINDLEQNCKHVWQEPRTCTQKINYDCGSYGGSYDTHWWERECSVCGKIEKTFKETCVKVPDFSDKKEEWRDGWRN
jgi:hypothetical protein